MYVMYIYTYRYIYLERELFQGIRSHLWGFCKYEINRTAQQARNSGFDGSFSHESEIYRIDPAGQQAQNSGRFSFSFIFFCLFVCLFPVQWIELRAWCFLGKYST
jgi:hypothetical protein